MSGNTDKEETMTITPAKLHSGVPLPLVALPQDTLLTVNIDQVPMIRDLAVPGIHIQTLRIDVERGDWVFLATCAPGCSLPAHYHTGPAQVYTFQGRWCYHEYPDQPQTAGSYLFEPGGTVHTFYCPADNTEDTVTLAWISGAQVSFNEDGSFHSLTDAVTLQYLTETKAAEQGLGTIPYIDGGSARVLGS
jgi:2,4'-dihydroxyacetophenone dioxygenase